MLTFEEVEELIISVLSLLLQTNFYFFLFILDLFLTLIFSFRALEVPESRVRKRSF